LPRANPGRTRIFHIKVGNSLDDLLERAARMLEALRAAREFIVTAPMELKS
jgi:hypothetical protein